MIQKLCMCACLLICPSPQVEGSTLQKLKEKYSTEAAAKAKEERIELLRRQSVRRMLHAGLSGAWMAWFKMWSAKSYAMTRLRQCANRLHSPKLSDAFGEWVGGWKEARAEQIRAEFAQSSAAQ